MDFNSFKIFLENYYLSMGKKMPAKFKKPPVPKLPMNVERTYRKALQDIVGMINKQIKTLLIPALPALINEANLANPRHDSYVDSLAQIFNTISFNIAQNMPDLNTFTKTIGIGVSGHNSGQFNKMMTKVFGVNIFQAEPGLQTTLDAFVSANVQLIRSIPAQELQNINQIVLAGLGSGRSASDMTRDIQKQFGVTERRANTIARDQVSKLNGQLTKSRHESVGIEEYIWQTAEDEKVRPTHRANDQKVYRYDDPPAATGNPGYDFLCRCVGIPVIPE